MRNRIQLSVFSVTKHYAQRQTPNGLVQTNHTPDVGRQLGELVRLHVEFFERLKARQRERECLESIVRQIELTQPRELRSQKARAIAQYACEQSASSHLSVQRTLQSASGSVLMWLWRTKSRASLAHAQRAVGRRSIALLHCKGVRRGARRANRQEARACSLVGQQGVECGNGERRVKLVEPLQREGG